MWTVLIETLRIRKNDELLSPDLRFSWMTRDLDLLTRKERLLIERRKDSVDTGFLSMTFALLLLLLLMMVVELRGLLRSGNIHLGTANNVMLLHPWWTSLAQGLSMPRRQRGKQTVLARACARYSLQAAGTLT